MNKLCRISELSHSASDWVKDKAFFMAVEEIFEEWQDSENGSDEISSFHELLTRQDFETLRNSSFFNMKTSVFIAVWLEEFYSEDDSRFEDEFDPRNEFVCAEELLDAFKTVTDEKGEPFYPVWKNQLFNMLCGIDHEFSGMSEEKLNQIGAE